MPELPEVETVVRFIAPRVTGKIIQHASLYSKRVTRGGLTGTAKALENRIIQKVRRRGKQIYFELDRGILYIHLGMTGKLLWNGEHTAYTRAEFVLNGGKLLYDDIRMFGRVEYFEGLPTLIERVGPDALTVPFPEFYSRLKKHRTALKPLLLNQTFISGVGNIYADEALFASSLHPRAKASRISQTRAELLHRNLIDILQLAIRHRGSSISDYVDPCGERGDYQQMHNVYGKTGEPCPRCQTPIRRIVLGQRSTHYCPRCQRV
ncbi:MAG TPA: DNA-formamidopyrimidine glycosylase [Bryobacteraceae bacterium]|nr:DNA-formamidopyrimidine glycosylase [Bryobacteraceae bacterium]